MRPLIKYDLDEFPTASSLGPADPPHRHARGRPPAKKRKRNHRNPQDYHNSQQPAFSTARDPPLQHWDDPGSVTVGMVYDEQEGSASTSAPVTVSYAGDIDEEEGECGEEGVEGDEAADVDVEQEEEEEKEKEEEESRALTHEEIWDDAALIDAWNSAEAEYEAYHGISKAWKTEPVKKSPLWYNKPYTEPTPQPGPSKPRPRSTHNISLEGGEPDTAPLDFHTFVPTHDPSLAIPSDTSTQPAATAPFFVPSPSTKMVSRDEAFNNALSAMYWSGYWTAVYHSQSQSNGQDNNATAGVTEENGIEVEEEEEDLVPAQR